MPGRPIVAMQASKKLEAYKARAKAEQQRRETVTDSEFWVALCFETRAQKDEFLRLIGAAGEGDKHVDGLALAKRMGLTMTSPRFPFRRSR